MDVIASVATRRLLAAALAAAALTGCGDEETGSEPAGGASTLSVTETDFAIDPKDATVETAGALRISVVNRGKAPHALAIEAPGGVVQTDTLEAGASGELEADLEQGSYTWFCPIGDHRQRGMEGKLTVGDAEASQDSEGSGGSRGSSGY